MTWPALCVWPSQGTLDEARAAAAAEVKLLKAEHVRSTDRIVIDKSQAMTHELVQTKAALQSLQAESEAFKSATEDAAHLRTIRAGGSLRTSTRPTLNLRLLLRASV